ncbi:glutamyl aminopeptidase-like [Actinia tenebrosa]|uniref:Glutamyl aminopeptidase-like n=1 Tax=Actinia tenebrosa TaxID=6105 RepID=A0A6P8HKM3_ACTTE|nr:glutamyl aminopeptidase-like [Actinia tenebrosa]
MEKETEIDPWEVFFQIMSFLSGKLPKESNAYKYLMKYMAFLGKNQYERLGFNDVGTMIDKIKREYFLSLFCKVQDKTCIGNATEHFQAWMEDPKNVDIPPNLRNVVYYYGVRLGGVKEWDFLYSQYNETKDPYTKNKILYGLSATNDPWITDRFDNNPTLAYLNVVSRLTTGFDTLYALSEFQRFQAQIEVSDESALKSIRERIKWLEKHEKEIEDVLEELLKKNHQM